MIRPGLVSITFRSLSPEEILTLCAENGLEGVEWGGDLHVPHGDMERAHRVGRISRDAGIELVSYGSYYRVGVSEAEGLPFSKVLDTAATLGTPLIRVWAGPQKDLSRYTEVDKNRVVDDALRIAEAARREGISIAYEYHRQSMTETNDSARTLLEAARDENILSYWQPPNGATIEYALEGLEMVLPRLAHLHVFHWFNRQKQFPLAEGAEAWGRYLKTASRSSGDHFALLEFVKGDSPIQLGEDARVLRSWLGKR